MNKRSASELLRQAIENERNIKRLAEYKARREAFIEEWCETPIQEYEQYYGVEKARYIDAICNYEWWKEQDQDKQWIAEQEAF